MSEPKNAFRQLREAIRRQILTASDTAPAGDIGGEAAMRTRQVASALRRYRPQPPAELDTTAFLDGVYERATRGSAAAIGPSLLRRTFAPIAAPRDVAWIEPDEVPDLADLMREPPSERASWQRERPWSQRRPAPLPLRRLVACAAAIVVGIGAFVVFRGTSAPPELVFTASDVPLSHENCTVFVLDVADR